MKNIQTVLLLLITIVFFACKSTETFTSSERNLIHSALKDLPFRVLQINNFEDSLILRTNCTDIFNFEKDTSFQLLIERMKSTLKAENGVGLAAPQIGISRNIFLYMRLDLPGEPIEVVVNPKIIHKSDTLICFERDGCLSIPDFRGNSIRYPWIEVEYHNEKGELKKVRLSDHSRQNSFTSVIFQHEFDHTRGVLFIDKLCK